MKPILIKNSDSLAASVIAAAESGVSRDPVRSDVLLWNLRVVADMAVAVKNGTTIALVASNTALEIAVKENYATMTIVCLRAAKDRAYEANLLAEGLLAKTRADVRKRFQELKAKIPGHFHETGCECFSCSPFRDSEDEDQEHA
jgi:hypothetical protein